jgi:PAS domain S-box-containing protein
MAQRIMGSVNNNFHVNTLNDFQIKGMMPEGEYESITRLASYLCKKPNSKISLIDLEHQSSKLLNRANPEIIPFLDSFCQLAIQGKGVLVIRDALEDPRTSKLTGILGEKKIRFYAGVPLISPDGGILGVLSVTDTVPGELDHNQKDALSILAQGIVSHLESALKNKALNDLILKYEDIRAMFNSSAELHCILDRSGKILVMNSVVERLFGFTPEEVIGHPIWEFFIEEDRNTMIPLIEKGLGAGNKSFELEGRIKLKNGSAKWMGWTIAVKNEKWFANGRDISARKRTEQELEILSTVASKSSSGIVIRDGNGKVTWINKAMENMFGYKLNELEGKRLVEVLVGKDTDLHPFNIAQKAIAEKKSYNIDLKLYKKDGSVIWVNKSTTPILNKKGVIERQVEIIIDITERKNAEEQLTLLSLVASKTVNGVAISSSDGKIKWVNQSLEDLTGYKLEDFKNTRPGDLLAGEGTDHTLLNTAREKATKCIPSYIELLSYRKDGTPIWLAISNTPTFNQDGSLDQQVEIINDISERKLVEQELIKAREDALQLSKAKETFLGVMSHEIRTPLNAVIGMSHILMDDNPTEAQFENLKILGFSAQNLLHLLNDVLDFTKIETGNMVLESVNVNLKELVSKTLNSLQFKTAEKAVILKSEIDHRIPNSVMGDNTRLYQILINLLSNSLKFTEKGEVKLKVDLIEEREKSVVVRFEIKDTGIGIAPDKIAYIFQSYTQADADTTRKYGGTGLGLAITKSLLELHNSNVTVESELGKGSVFSFIIEFNRSEKSYIQMENKTQIQPLSGNILVVEDNEINRLLANKVLTKWGVQVDFAENGEIALKKIQMFKYDLILMDLHMPVMDGMEAAKAIRKLGGPYSRLPIIALTASLFSHELETITESGMDGYVIKPFVPNDLYNKIKSFLVSKG